MLLGPIFGRELITSARRAGTFGNRAFAAGLAAAIVGACAWAWDWQGWDRSSVAGAAAFGLKAFGVIAAVQAIFVMVVVPTEVAPGIAGERDRKSLDTLLATRLTAAEVVIGAMAAGLARYATGLVATLPVLALCLGGVDPRLVLLAGAGLASTAVAAAALSVAASVGAPTAKRAVATAGALTVGWICAPFATVFLLPRLWPAAAGWASPAALWLLDSGPVAVAANLVGLIRRASPGGALLRMIALQLGGAAALTGWSAWRLRPASRALYDGVGRAALLRSLRTRRRPRPACGDDPVFWNEIHATRGAGPVERLVSRAIHATWLGFTALAAFAFAAPAFAELAARGYGAAPEAMTLPELNPFLRLLVGRFSRAFAAPAPGQARLEFNMAIRQASAGLELMFALGVAAFAAEGVATERERDTWLGLIATPLSGREILRAKGLGALWRCRAVPFVMLSLWIVGLLAGALHPLGALAGLFGLAASAAFFAALGASVSIRASDRRKASGWAILPLFAMVVGWVLLLLPAGRTSVLLGAASPPFLTWSALLSYEDVRAAASPGPFPQLPSIHIRTGEGPGRVLAAWLIGTAGQFLGAFLLARAAARDFDAAVGRPTRPRTSAALAGQRVLPIQERAGLGEDLRHPRGA